MRLTTATVNRIVDDLASRLNGGALVIYNGSQNELVRVPLDSPAFESAVDGIAVAIDLPESVILATGEGSRAQWQTAQGEGLADLVVRGVDAEDADAADVLLDRTDFQRGGMCSVSRATLSLKRSTTQES